VAPAAGGYTGLPVQRCWASGPLEGVFFFGTKQDTLLDLLIPAGC